MHIISKKKLREFGQKHPDAKEPLDAWHRIAGRVKWRCLADARLAFPHADPYKECTIFNIGGNKYRLITKIYNEDQIVLIRFILTHPEYDRGKWKDDCYC